MIRLIKGPYNTSLQLEILCPRQRIGNFEAIRACQLGPLKTQQGIQVHFCLSPRNTNNSFTDRITSLVNSSSAMVIKISFSTNIQDPTLTILGYGCSTAVGSHVLLSWCKKVRFPLGDALFSLSLSFQYIERPWQFLFVGQHWWFSLRKLCSLR